MLLPIFISLPALACVHISLIQLDVRLNISFPGAL
nr:MAG TPA: hypothetical protein [Caudoviricetes sp.]